MTPTLDGACSLYNPRETAPVHRHTPSASRLGLEGVGGFSTVQGEKCTLGRGDLVLTPNGTWHDFGNESDEQIVFIDVVNDPLCLALGGTFYELGYSEIDSGSNSDEPIPKRLQSIREPLDYSQNLYATGGMVPKFAPQVRARDRDASPMFVYRYDETRATPVPTTG
jgi:gentisate 1,2-dioxygenase